MLSNGGSTYTYPPAGSAQPHGVSSMQTVFGSIGFAYDLDGNVATETGAAVRTLVFTPFNMPQSVNNGGSGGKTITFQYDADHNRVMQSAPEGTTYYLPDGEQTPGAVWHTYFQMDGQRIAEDYGVTGALKHHYFHNDDQNTIGLVTDDTFNVANFPNGAWNVQNEGAAPFGQPRAANGGADWTWGAGDVTRRRWINQEDLADVQLIDLNARLYDPSIGKFYSPDPIIADQDDSQSWNAYAYSHNNPMSKSDPTGLDEEDGGGVVDVTGAEASGGRFGGGANGEFGSGGVSSPQVYGQSSFYVFSVFGRSSGSPSGAGSVAGGLQHQSVQVAQAAMGLCVLGPGGCAAGTAITAGQLLTGAAVIGGVAGGAIVVQHEMDNAQGTADGAQAPASDAGDKQENAQQQTNGHHSDPKFMGGKSDQKLTDMPAGEHQQLHQDLNKHLEGYRDSQGNTMRPTSANPGDNIRGNFTREERLKAMSDFYNGSGAKYPDAANDFFDQHPEQK
jgi:RHS repeat-associated protein